MRPNNANGATNAPPPLFPNLMRVFSERKKVILTVFLGVVMVVTLISFLLPPTYKATSKILVEQEVDPEKAILLNMNYPKGYDNYNWILSEIEIIKSYPVTSQVVKKLNLHKLDVKTDRLSKAEEEKRFEETMETFQQDLNVENDFQSNVIEISYEAKKPTLAAVVVTNIFETYIKYRSEMSDESKTYKFFEEQLKIADKKLRELEQRQASFKSKEAILSPETQVKILLTKLADYEKSLTENKTKRIGKEARLAVIRELQKTGSTNIPATEVSDSPSREKYIAKLRGELLDMEIRKDELLQRFRPTYKEVVELEHNIAATQKKIQREIQQIIEQEETAVKVLRAEERELKKLIDQTNQQVKEFSQKEYEIAQISRGIDDNRAVYSMLLKQREEARISGAKSERDVKIKVISPAVIPNKPVKPKKLLNLVLAMILGLTGGFGLAWYQEVKESSANYADAHTSPDGLNLRDSVHEIESEESGSPS